MGKNPVVAVIAAIVLIVALIFIFKQMGGGGGVGSPQDAYWYDLDTGELFGHKNVTPPVPAPSGGEGVRAHVYACNDCNDKTDRFISFLERYTEEGKKFLEKEQAAGTNPMFRAEALQYSEVRREEDTEWVSGANMEETIAVRAQYETRCGGKPAKPCFVFQD